jgi:hypothetical protein
MPDPGCHHGTAFVEAESKRMNGPTPSAQSDTLVLTSLKFAFDHHNESHPMMLSVKRLVEHLILCDFPYIPLSIFREITKI